MSLRIIDPGFFTTLQDLGRKGYERYGVPVSGVMDYFSFMVANKLLNNPIESSAIEISLSGAKFLAEEDCLIALTGSGFGLSVQNKSFPLWMAIRVRSKDIIQIFPKQNPGWAYLAISGGFQVKPVLGSCSTYTRGGFGGLNGKPLAAEDRLQSGSPITGWQYKAGTYYLTEKLPPYQPLIAVRVIPGPQLDAFSDSGIQTFLKSTYQISSNSDRMGYRLEGPKISHISTADIISEGMVLGSIQVPPNGQPIIMMSDRQTAGGYAKIATVISADIPLLAQCPIGSGQVRFQTVTLDVAKQLYLERINSIEQGIEFPEDFQSY